MVLRAFQQSSVGIIRIKVVVNGRIDIPGGTRRCKSTDHRSWTSKTTQKERDSREIVEGMFTKKGKSRCSRCSRCVSVQSVQSVRSRMTEFKGSLRLAWPCGVISVITSNYRWIEWNAQPLTTLAEVFLYLLFSIVFIVFIVLFI